MKEQHGSCLEVDIRTGSYPVDPAHFEHRGILRQLQAPRPDNRDRFDRAHLGRRGGDRESKRTGQSPCNGRCHLRGYRCRYGRFLADVLYMEPRRNGVHSSTTDRGYRRRHSRQRNLGRFVGNRGYRNAKSSKKIIAIERRNLVCGRRGASHPAPCNMQIAPVRSTGDLRVAASTYSGALDRGCANFSELRKSEV